MCGRYASYTPPDVMRGLFRTTNPLPNVAASWNVAPSQLAMVVRRQPETGKRHLDLLTWGLLPHWTKDLKAARRPINARAETITASPMFRSAFEKRRCIVPADAFYEWHSGPTGKQPFAITRSDATPMAFAGLWEGWTAETGTIVRSFAIITTSANRIMSEIHDRMPVILDPAVWPAWLGEKSADAAALLRPAPDDLLRLWPVSTSVNAPRNNGPELLTPISAPFAGLEI